MTRASAIGQLWRRMLENPGRSNLAEGSVVACARRITDMLMVIGALGVENFDLASQCFGKVGCIIVR